MSVAPLALCARVLYDREILDLKLEKERLVAELDVLGVEKFWIEHSKSDLHRAMMRFNHSERQATCACLACKVTGRFDLREGVRPFRVSRKCTWQPAFERLCAECGITTAHSWPTVETAPAHIRRSYGNVSDADVHLVTYARGDWFWWSLGKKLWSVKKVSDAELIRFDAFVRKLEEKYFADVD